MDDKLSAFIEAHGVDAALIANPSTQQTLKAHEALVALGHDVNEHQMIKALVCVPVVGKEFSEQNAILALVAGCDRLDLKALAKLLGYSRILVADQATAERLSGYPR